MNEAVSHWITQYGYLGIFSLLVLGIVGLPVPDEWLLTFSGYLVFSHKLSFSPTFLAAFTGSACGMSVSYVLGRKFGMYLLHKLRWLIRIKQKDIDRVHRWFERGGRWVLVFGYFIPGVRHFTAYVAGTSGLELSGFALFAYTGAFFWSLSFIFIGYFLGEEWSKYSEKIHSGGLVLAGLAVMMLLGYWVFRIITKHGD